MLRRWMLICLFVACSGLAWAKPAVNIFRVTFESERYPGIGFGRTDIGGMEREHGTVWFQNESDSTLTDTRLILHFTDQSHYRASGSREYRVGKLDGHQSVSINYTWENVADEKVYPWVEITYRMPDGSQQKAVSYPYGY